MSGGDDIGRILIYLGFGEKSSSVERVVKELKTTAAIEGVGVTLIHLPFVDEELGLPWIYAGGKVLRGKSISEEEFIELVLEEAVKKQLAEILAVEALGFPLTPLAYTVHSVEAEA